MTGFGILRQQYGISVAESQTFLLAKRPPAAMSEEKRLFSQAILSPSFIFSWTTIPNIFLYILNSLLVIAVRVNIQPVHVKVYCSPVVKVFP